MSELKNINIDLSKECLTRLDRKRNTFGTSRTDIVNFLLFLYRDMDLSEQEIEAELLEQKNTKTAKTIRVNLNPYVSNLIKNKNRYYYSVKQFVYAFLKKILKCTEDWKVFNQVQKKTNRNYRVQSEVWAWLQNFTEKTGIPLSIIVNYVLSQEVDLDKKLPTSYKDKERRSFSITEDNYEYLSSFNHHDRGIILQKHLYEFMNTITV